jgi:hypothetical protein
MDRKTESPAPAGLGNSAGRQSNSGKATHTTKPRSAGVSFVLPINDHFRLTAAGLTATTHNASRPVDKEVRQ